MRVLVLGGTAFLGPHVVRELVDAGRDVTVFHRGEHEADLPDSVRHVHGDFARWDEHVDALRALAPEVVVDMTPYVRADARRLASFAGVAHRGVAVSSADVYLAYGRIWQTEPGDPVPVPLLEDSPLRAVVVNEDYDKVGVEEELAAISDLPVTVVRAPAIHGPGDPQHRLWSYLKRMDDGRPAILVTDDVAGWRWVRGYVEDVAHSIALCAVDERSSGRTYNVGDPVAFTEVEWAQQVAAVHGWDGEIVVVPKDALPARDGPELDFRQDYVVDSTRIREELGYEELVEPDEALRRTIEWERANPPGEPDDPFDYAAEDAARSSASTSSSSSVSPSN